MIERNDLKNYENKIVWICHTNWEKRIIKPTPVFVGKVDMGKYSQDIELFKLNKNGSVGKSKITYMNRGRQSMFERTAVLVFEKEFECRLYFEMKCNEQIKYYTNLKQ